jgi:hypothetical protein
LGSLCISDGEGAMKWNTTVRNGDALEELCGATPSNGLGTIDLQMSRGLLFLALNVMCQRRNDEISAPSGIDSTLGDSFAGPERLIALLAEVF